MRYGNRAAVLVAGRRAEDSLAWVVGCAALTALAARCAMHLPFTPVPVTWQVGAVLFCGLASTPRAAFRSIGMYLAAGLAGAPVFAFGTGGFAYALSPTGGYLIAMPVAAWLVALIARRSAGSVWRDTVACVAGLSVIYAAGCAWLAITLHLSLVPSLVQGAGWFLVWDAAKAMAAVALARRWSASHWA